MTIPISNPCWKSLLQTLNGIAPETLTIVGGIPKQLLDHMFNTLTMTEFLLLYQSDIQQKYFEELKINLPTKIRVINNTDGQFPETDSTLCYALSPSTVAPFFSTTQRFVIEVSTTSEHLDSNADTYSKKESFGAVQLVVHRK